MDKEKRAEEIKAIKKEVCDKYCKYSDKEKDFEMLMCYCNRCPLNRLK